jgi:RimJ/RimL family protein N-acetyltransferase
MLMLHLLQVKCFLILYVSMLVSSNCGIIALMEFETGKIHKQFKTKSGKDCVIRWVKIEDSEQLMHFINALSKEDTYIGYGPESTKTLPQEAAFVANRMKACLLRDASFVIAEIDGRIIATSGIDIDYSGHDRTKHIAGFGIAILDGYRSEGIGSQLIDTMIDHAKNYLSGISMIKLTVFAENQRAIGLYEKSGFIKVGTIPNGVKRKGKLSGHDIMVKEL